MKRIAALLVLAIALASCGAETHTIKGGIAATQPCDEVSHVVIKNGNGTGITVATNDRVSGNANQCLVLFHADGIPDIESYTVTFGHSPDLLQGPTWTHDEMEANGWTMEVYQKL